MQYGSLFEDAVPKVKANFKPQRPVSFGDADLLNAANGVCLFSSPTLHPACKVGFAGSLE